LAVYKSSSGHCADEVSTNPELNSLRWAAGWFTKKRQKTVLTYHRSRNIFWGSALRGTECVVLQCCVTPYQSMPGDRIPWTLPYPIDSGQFVIFMSVYIHLASNRYMLGRSEV